MARPASALRAGTRAPRQPLAEGEALAGESDLVVERAHHGVGHYRQASAGWRPVPRRRYRSRGRRSAPHSATRCCGCPASSPSSAMILAVGPFTALPPMMGETAIDGRAAGPQRLAHARHRQDRIDAEPGIGGADDDAGQRRARTEQPRALRRLGRASGRALVADVAHHRPALLAHEILLEGERALRRSPPPCARDRPSWAARARATPSFAARCAQTGGQRLRRPRAAWCDRRGSRGRGRPA